MCGVPQWRCSLSIVFFLFVMDALLFIACHYDLFIHAVFVLFCFPFAVYLQSLSSRLSQISPAFDPSRSENTSDACKRHTRQFIDALHRFELWAFRSNFSFYKYTISHHTLFLLVCSIDKKRLIILSCNKIGVGGVTDLDVV